MAIAAQLNVETFAIMRQHSPRKFEWLRIDSNYNCNVHCVYCHSNRSDQVLSLDDLELFLTENVLGIENVQYGCVMEPTLDQRLVDVMRLVASSSSRPEKDTVVQTNGILLHTHDFNLMREAGLTHLSVSIDTTNPVTLSKLRGGSSFSKISRNVIEFRKACPTVRLQILTTVNRANIAEITELVAWGLGIGADRFVLREIFHYPENKIVDHEKTKSLLLEPGQYSAMQRDLESRFGKSANFHFAPIEDLKKHATEVFRNLHVIRPVEPSE